MHDDVTLRPLEKKDLKFIRRLRNENRQFFLDSGYISTQSHKQWYEKYLKKTDDRMFILEKNATPIGCGAIYRIDQRKQKAEVGRFIIDKPERKKSYGNILIQKIEEIAFNKLGLQQVYLEVLENNKQALDLYNKAGYQKEEVMVRQKYRIVRMAKKSKKKLILSGNDPLSE